MVSDFKMKSQAIITLSLLAVCSLAYTTKETLHCREHPNTGSRIITTITKGADIPIYCQNPAGENIHGSRIWDWVEYDDEICWVSDYYVKTDSTGMVTDKCHNEEKRLVVSYPVKEDLNCRTERNSHSKIQHTFKKGQYIDIYCQSSRGQNIHGSKIWDAVEFPGGGLCWVSDYYVKTGSSGIITIDCENPEKRSVKSSGGTYPVKEDLHCRSGTNTDSPIVKTFKKGEQVKIYCQDPNGQNIHGSKIWDLIELRPDAPWCYVSDYYVKTGSSDMVTRRCPTQKRDVAEPALNKREAIYPVKEDLHCRSRPNTNAPIVRTIPKGAEVGIFCQDPHGQNIHGSTIWDLLDMGTSPWCYVSDYYVKTGSSGFVTTKCGGGRKRAETIPNLDKRAKSYPVKEDLHCRKEPNTSSRTLTTFKKGTYVEVYCQNRRGENIQGSKIWDFVPLGVAGCFVSDYYVKTGSSGMVAPDCIQTT